LEYILSEIKQQGVSLAHALYASAKILELIQEGSSLTSAIQTTSPSLRPAVQSITFHALRRGFWVHAVLNEYLNKTPSGLTKYLLWAAVALIPEKDREPMYATHTLVNEAVNATSLDKNMVYAKGLVNAVLRRILRSEDIYAEFSELKNPSYPEWWVRKLRFAYPENYLNILATSREKPPLTIRVNERFINATSYKEKLDGLEIESNALPEISGIKLPNALEIKKPIPVAQLPGFFDGSCSVQDAGAQLAAYLLNPKPGARVLDACAAPGGKSAQLLEQFDIQLDCLEIDSERAKRIDENLMRLRLQNGRILIGDAADTQILRNEGPYDAILADVPCSASGIVRRHPDIPYLRQEADIQKLQITQKKILTALWGLLKPGGRLLYVTCSVFPDEGESQARWSVNNLPGVIRLKAPGQLLPSVHHDGFFYALFEKSMD
jgi:16S rRNA (cytosine967-C5)-methyltransferase